MFIVCGGGGARLVTTVLVHLPSLLEVILHGHGHGHGKVGDTIRFAHSRAMIICSFHQLTARGKVRRARDQGRVKVSQVGRYLDYGTRTHTRTTSMGLFLACSFS